MSLAQYTRPDFRGFGSIGAQDTWDASLLHGCVCDEGYDGIDCTQRSCSAGIDPLADSTVERPEVQLLRCDFAATDDLDLSLGFGGQFTRPILAGDTVGALWQKLNELATIGTISVKYLSADGLVPTFCEDADGDGKSSNLVEVTFTSNAGDVAALQLVSASTGKALQGAHSNKVFVAHSDDGLERDGDNVVLVSRTGSTKLVDCSGRGKCSKVTGQCTCDDGFVAVKAPSTPGPWSECGKMLSAPIHCPGRIKNIVEQYVDCSGHGSCSGTPHYQCKCLAGWAGHDCSLNACPHGHVWFGKQQRTQNSAHSALAECSAAGTCNTLQGQCECLPGFTGEACERMQCPGEILSGKTCSGHGQCLSMRNAALHATSEFDVPVEYVYGQIPNNPATWDADHIYTCVCDDAFEGYDCSRRICSRGDDTSTEVIKDAVTNLPRTEVQRILCAFQHGASPNPSLHIEYKKRQSHTITANAGAAGVKLAIESLPGISNAQIAVTSVEFDRGSTICAPAGQKPVSTLITFDTTHDLEQLAVRGVDSSELLVSEQAELVFNGHIENAVCNNKGLCNTQEGVCDCFSGWGSSDGHGKAGGLGDCGYRMPEGAANEGYVARTNLRARIHNSVEKALNGQR